MSACTTTIPLDLDQGERRLILNAQWDNAEEEHLAYAGISDKDRMLPAEAGTICCYVDEEPVSLSNSPVRIVSDQACYGLHAGLKPGNRMKLEFMQGSEKAYSEVTVPEKAGKILKVDTLQKAGQVQFKVTIKDLSQERNYFRLRIVHIYHASVYRRDSSGEMVLISENDGIEDLALSNEMDPILKNGKLGGSIDEKFFDITAPNLYSVFSDRLFSGDECTLSVSVDENKLYSIKVGDLYDKISIRHKAEIRLETITLQTYDYLVALDQMESGQSDSFSLLEPAVLPSNVIGGTGFVSVSTPDIQTINLKEARF